MIWHPTIDDPWIVAPPEGAILILRASADWTYEQAVEARDQMRQLSNREVIVLAPGVDLAVLPEDEMRALGWCRCEPPSDFQRQCDTQ